MWCCWEAAALWQESKQRQSTLECKAAHAGNAVVAYCTGYVLLLCVHAGEGSCVGASRPEAESKAGQGGCTKLSARSSSSSSSSTCSYSRRLQWQQQRQHLQRQSLYHMTKTGIVPQLTALGMISRCIN
jgi:hypothetical protein